MTFQSPRISVIINTYQSERFVSAAIDSVLAQTLPPFEILVMDDGSTDATASIVRQYAPAVSWQQQPNAGVAHARNTIVARARGDLVAFLDADDWWEPTKLQVQAAAFRAIPTPDAVFGHVRQFIDPDLDPAVAARLWAPTEPVPGRIATTMLITPQALARVGGFTSGLRITEFLDWYARALEAGLHMPMLPDMVAWRRIHGENHSMRYSEDLLEYTRVIKAALDRRRQARQESGV